MHTGAQKLILVHVLQVAVGKSANLNHRLYRLVWQVLTSETGSSTHLQKHFSFSNIMLNHAVAQGNQALQGAAAQAALATAAASSMASVVLADPGQRHKSGLVLSLAPLMGAAAQVDSSHPKWLHVHVRPPVRGLLKLLKVGRGFKHLPHAHVVSVVSTASSWQSSRSRVLCA